MSVVRTCDGKIIKVTDCIIKVVTIRGNITWCYFALRDLAYKQIAHGNLCFPLWRAYLLLLCIYCYVRVKVFFPIPFYFLFCKHHVARKDLGTYTQLDMGGMSYYCWHHPWGKYVGRWNYKPLSFYVSGLKRFAHVYAVSVSNHRRLNDGWVCGLV